MIVVLQRNLANFHLADVFEESRRSGAFAYELRWEDLVTVSEANDVAVVVPGTHVISAEYIRKLHEAFPRLSHIALPMTGDDGLDKQECADRGIGFSKVQGYSTEEMAEYAETLALSLRHEIVPKALAMQNGKWDDKPTVEIRGTRVGILGLGAIGMATAARFARRGCTVVGWNRSVKEGFARLGGRQVPLGELFATAEILLVHLPVVRGEGGTEGIVSEKLIATMGKIDFVNVSRADLVDGDALLAAVLDQRLHGAALDVFLPEPPFGAGNAWARLCSLDPGRYNLICQPHMGFKKRGALRRLADGVLANISSLRPAQENE